MYIVIPAYEPDIRLIQVVQDITLHPSVMDGSLFAFTAEMFGSACA